MPTLKQYDNMGTYFPFLPSIFTEELRRVLRNFTLILIISEKHQINYSSKTSVGWEWA